MSYTAPVKDMLFDIRHLGGIDEIAKIPGFEEAGFDTAQAVLEECAKFNEGVVAPLNVEGDRNPSSWKDGKVTTVDKTWKYVKDDAGKLRIVVHHSSLEYSGT